MFGKSSKALIPKVEYGKVLSLEKDIEVAESIARCFMEDKILFDDIDPHGISSLSVIWKDLKVVITWYSSDDFRSLDIGYDSCPFTGKAVEIIFAAAMERAKGLSKERLTNLHDKL